MKFLPQLIFSFYSLPHEFNFKYPFIQVPLILRLVQVLQSNPLYCIMLYESGSNQLTQIRACDFFGTLSIICTF